MRHTYITITFIFLLGIVLTGCQTDQEAKTAHPLNLAQIEKETKDKIPETEILKMQNDHLSEAASGEINEEGVTVVSVPTSIQVVVNKDRKLPDGYEPPDLTIPEVPFQAVNEERKHLRKEAALALEELFADAEEADIELVAVSGFRRYDTQEFLYNHSVETNGKEYADQYSAQPGHSEHQTGLAMDVSSSAVAFDLVEAFEETPAGQWVAENAHRFGFVIRYPEGKSDITGYNYEPWHLRYIGEEIATDLFEQDITIENYFGLVDEASL